MTKKAHSLRSFVFFSRSGCLLPSLIILNFLFGWIFLRPLHWLLLEVILTLLFILNVYIITKKIFSASGRRTNIIDVEGKIVEDKPKLKEF